MNTSIRLLLAASAGLVLFKQPVLLGAQILLAQDFNSGDGGFTAVTSGSATGWGYDAGQGAWTARLDYIFCSQPRYSRLTSPTLTVTQPGGVTLDLVHHYSFEYDGTTRWDGGAVFISVNGGTFSPVPANRFTRNGYVGILTGNTVLNGLPGFNADSAGYPANITSKAYLGYFNAGDTLQLQFVAGWDECSGATEPNWFIDELVVAERAMSLFEHAVLTLGAEAYWRLNETSGTVAQDYYEGNHATHSAVTPGVAGPQPPACAGFNNDNLAAQYDGANSYTLGPAGLMNNRAAFTMTGWLNPTDLSHSLGLFGQNDAVEFGVGSGGNAIVLWTSGGGSVTAGVTGQIHNGEWCFVAAVGDGTSLKIYLNGRVLATGVGPTVNYGSSAYGFNIGGNVFGGGAGAVRPNNGYGWIGYLDEIALFDRALSADDVNFLFLTGKYRMTTSSNTTGDTAGLSDAASSTDLLQGLAPAYSRIPFFDYINGAPAPAGQSGLTDGTATVISPAEADGAYLPETFNGGRLPCTVTFLLDTAAAPAGYNLTKINSFAGWRENGRTLANQTFELFLRQIGGDYTSLGTFQYLPFTAADGTGTSSSLISLIGLDTSSLATRVDSVRFVFQVTGVTAPNAVDGLVVKELDVFGYPAALAQSTANTTGDTAGLGQDASSTDLLQGLAPTYSRPPFFDFINGAAAPSGKSGLTDGSATTTGPANAGGAYLPETFAGGRLPCTVTFMLDTSLAPNGYDITKINSFAGWHENGRTLANQSFELLARPAGGANYFSLGSYSTIPFTSTAEAGLSSSLISVTGTHGAVIRGIDSVRFVFQPIGLTAYNGIDGYVIKELDVFGVPSGIAPLLALTTPKPRQVIQRGRFNTADILLDGILTSAPDVARIEARAVVMDGLPNNGTSTDWITISTATSGDFAGVLPAVAAGGWYRIEVRAVDEAGNELASASVERVGVGDIFITAGQSNAACFGGERIAPDDDRVSAWSAANDSWQLAADPQPNPSGAPGDGGSPWPILGTALAYSEDVPIGFAAVAWGASGLSLWQPDGPAYVHLSNALRAFGSYGVRAVLWHQGESDSLASTTAAGYAQLLGNTVARSRADAGWPVPWGIAEASFHPDATRAQEEPVAAGQRLFTYTTAHCFRGPRTDDFNLEGKLSDTVHFNSEGLADHAQQWADAILGTQDLSVKNGDFEANSNLADGTADYATRVIGWNRLDQPGTALAPGNNGYFNPDASTYPNSGDAVNGGVLPNMSGRHAGTLAAGAAGNAFLQTLRAHLQPNTAYTLTAALGVRNNADLFGGYRLDILANGVPLGSGAVGDLATLNALAGGNAAGKFTVVSYTFISPLHIPTNQQLAIRLTKLAGPGTYLDFDAVSVLSAPAPVSPPSITRQPAPVTVLAGGQATLNVIAEGVPPPSYQWRKDGNDLGDPRPSESLTLMGVSAADSGDYTVVASNPAGTVTSEAARVQVIEPGPGTYASVIAGIRPFAYWPLDETVPGTVYDVWSGHHGTHGLEATVGAEGQRSPAHPAFPGTNMCVLFSGAADSRLVLPPLNLNTNTLTITCWFNRSGDQPPYAGLVFCRAGSTVAGLHFGDHNDLCYTWNGAVWESGRVPVEGMWIFVALMVTPTQAIMYLGNYGTLGWSIHDGPHAIEEFDGVLHIGQDSSADRSFRGYIDEVAVYNRTLSEDELLRLCWGPFAQPLTIERSGDSYILTWPGEAMLQATDDLDAANWETLHTGYGPYTDTPEPTRPCRFYRLLML